MYRLLTLCLALLLTLSGCLKLPGLVGPSTTDLALAGTVCLEGYGIQATSTQVSQGATVSLIDPVSGNTFATTLTQSSGGFTLSRRTWTPVPNRPYLLEALKGLSTDSAGASEARVRTLVTVYGHGLSANAADQAVTLNGQAAGVTAASADGTSLRFQVPTGLAPGTYPIVVTYGPWSSSILTFTVPP